MATYTYKKLNDVITVTDVHTYGTIDTLSYNNEPVFFGLEDGDKKYEGNLTQTTYTISSDCDGCYAKTINDAQCTLGTALKILFYISENDSENSRTITYKYNNTPLFKILQSGYKYFYFNKVDITSTITINPAYMIVIDDEFTTSIPAINSPGMPALNYTKVETIYYFYTLYNTAQTFNPSISTFTYISGGGDILGNQTALNTYQQVPQMIAKYDSTTQKITRISFSSYKTQIKYIGIFIKSNTAKSFELQTLIDFSESSKYKVE